MELQPICSSDEIMEGGNGFRFKVFHELQYVPAFIVRFQDKVYGYLNRCAHQAIELDWNPGEFFDNDRRFLVCATHGAVYEPETGDCVTGRCNGRALISLDIEEVDGVVYVRSNRPVTS